jgi:hypothetical protein
MAWSHLLRDGKRLRIDISFIYKEATARSRSSAHRKSLSFPSTHINGRTTSPSQT